MLPGEHNMIPHLPPITGQNYQVTAMDNDPIEPSPALPGANQNQGLGTEKDLATRTPDKEENWPTAWPWEKKRLMRKDRRESEKQTPSESTQVHNPWSDWRPNFEKPGAHRFTAKPDCREKNKYSNDSKITKLISINVKGGMQDLEGNDLSLWEFSWLLFSASPHTTHLSRSHKSSTCSCQPESFSPASPKCAVSTSHRPNCAP